MATGSKWYYLSEDGAEVGPLVFAELAAMLAGGSLTPESLVRGDAEEGMRRADTVVGLLRLARAIQSEATEQSEKAEPSKQLEQASNHECEVENPETLVSSGLSWRRLALLTGLLGLGAWWLNSWVFETRRFPRSAANRGREPLHFPLVGEISNLELTVLVVDVIVLIVFAIDWLRRRQDRISKQTTDLQPHGRSSQKGAESDIAQ